MPLKRQRSSSASSHSSLTSPAFSSSSEQPPPSKIRRLSPAPTLTFNNNNTVNEDQTAAPFHPVLDPTCVSVGPGLLPVKDHFSMLSDELLIRILHHLPVECVLLCSRVSHKFRRLSADAQIWKGLYYERFVRPRALRIPGVIKPSRSKSQLEVEEGESGDRTRVKAAMRSGLPSFDSRKSKWLDEVKLLDVAEEDEKDEEDIALQNSATDGRTRRRKATDWKARYRLRHNWSIGAAEVREIGIDIDGVSDSITEDEDIDDATLNRSLPRATLMASLVDGVVVTVDSTEGIRAWDIKVKECFAQSLLNEHIDDPVQVSPTSLAVDAGSEPLDGIGVVVGFMDGGFGIWSLKIRDINGRGSFERRYRTPVKSQTASVQGRLTAVAYSHPYLLTITADHILSLYVFGEKIDHVGANHVEDSSKVVQCPQPRLLTSLNSHTSWPPVSLSIRSTPHSIIASIAYAIPTYLSGWSVGLQELHLSHSGTILRSRLASAVEQGFQSLFSVSTPPNPAFRNLRTAPYNRYALTQRSRSLSSSSSSNRTHPISLSYSHPYLLAGNRDNTLSLYLVTSNNDELKISRSTTLWGHTSSVATALVGGRGKAVSISARGGELRVWELERGLGRKMGGGARSVRVWSDLSDAASEHQETTKARDREVGRGLCREGLTEGEEMAADSQTEMETETGTEMEMGWVGFDDEVVIVLRREEVSPAPGGKERRGNESGKEAEGEEKGRRRGRKRKTKKRTLRVYDFT